MSQLTTHVLDTSKGLPAAGIHIVLEKPGKENEWIAVANGTTNSDGRIGNLLSDEIAPLLPNLLAFFRQN